MKRWVWKVLLIMAAVMALTGTAWAEEVVAGDLRYETATGTVLGPVNKASIENVKIPAQVNGTDIVRIAPGAFDSCGILKTVEISEKLTTIGKGAFNGCGQLSNVFFSKNSSITTIEEDAFAGCGSLNNVILPDQLTSIKAGTFDGCGKLTAIYIPTSVQRIEADAFYLDTQLTILHYAGQDTTTLIQDDKVPRAVHYSRMREPTQALAPTCTAEGKEIITIGCGECNRVLITQERSIPALGHSPGEEIPEVAATCVKGGFTAGHWCARAGCGGIADGREPTKVDPDNHTSEMEMPDKDASCTTPGSSGGKQCMACGVETEAPTVIDALGHDFTNPAKTEERILKEATCTEPGEKFEYSICERCGEVEECEDCKELSADETKEEEYRQHLRDHHNLQEISLTGHTEGEAEYVVTLEPTCVNEGKAEWKVVCSVCGEPMKDGTNPPEDGMARVIPPEGHTAKKEVDEDQSKAATCTEGGRTVYKKATCTVCGAEFEFPSEDLEPLGHDLKDQKDKVVKEATCTQDGEKWINYKTCQREDCDYEEHEVSVSRAAHTWTDPKPDESKEDVAATCGTEGTSHVIVTCSVCKKTEAQTIPIPATGEHSWGEWTTKEPTETEDGEDKRVCSVCGKEDTVVRPATGDSENPGDPDKPEKPEIYQITLVQGSGGSLSASRKTAEAGDRVTVTVEPESGYELDMVRVVPADGGSPRLTDLGGGDYRFTMPDSNVEVRATFQRRNSGGGGSSSWASAPGDGSDGNPRRTTDPMPTQNAALSVPRAGVYGQLFQDIPTSHWAAGEINWANQMGYMNGSAGRFNPDGTITHQQMWMVLARLTGSRPANMTEARRWAVENSFAEGSSPDSPVARHQLVTALYRCAHLMGSSNRNTTSLAGYADSRIVPAVARDAFAWAVANGIVGGTANGRLDPNGTLTRAQFAVILYRYSQRI